jgi:integrase
MLDRLLRERKDEYLFPSTAQNQYAERSVPISKAFSRLKTRLSFDARYNFHSIRKTAATLFERAECPEGIAADILGHEKPTMTFGTYSGGSAMKQKQAWMERSLVYPDEQFMTAE